MLLLEIPFLEQLEQLVKDADDAILLFIGNHLHCGFLDAVMPVVTSLGDLGIVWIAVAAFLFFLKKEKKWAGLMLCALLATVVLGDGIIKPIIERMRPFLSDPHIVLLIPPPSGFSFPSGHSGSSFAAATVLCFYHKKAGAAALLLAFLIAFSRLYLSVHYPSDVLAGALLGVAVAFCTVWAARKLEKKCKHLAP